MRRSQKGSAALEFAIIAPGVLALVALIIFAGRFALAQMSVNAAAASAARAASIERSASSAKSSAQAMATRILASEDLSCATVHVNTDTSGFKVDVGMAASVTTTVRCDVNLSGLSVIGVPGTMTLSADATSPLDTYRARQ